MIYLGSLIQSQSDTVVINRSRIHNNDKVLNVGGDDLQLVTKLNSRDLTVTPRFSMSDFFQFGSDSLWSFLKDGEYDPIELRSGQLHKLEFSELVAVSVINGLILSECDYLRVRLWRDVNNIKDGHQMQNLYAPNCQRLEIELVVPRDGHELPTISCTSGFNSVMILRLSQSKTPLSVVGSFQNSVLNVPNLEMLDVSANPHMIEMIPTPSFSNLVWLHMMEEEPKPYEQSLHAKLAECDFESLKYWEFQGHFLPMIKAPGLLELFCGCTSDDKLDIGQLAANYPKLKTLKIQSQEVIISHGNFCFVDLIALLITVKTCREDLSIACALMVTPKLLDLNLKMRESGLKKLHFVIDGYKNKRSKLRSLKLLVSKQFENPGARSRKIHFEVPIFPN
ncbi:hypothetical protein WICPIJ_007232 [Wickerhamomyces pijperi]|uniref:Uncharacterized protein n=1 Tax=Wickerhamomyces pijperi TaxID=599730 RepID=A0A9P8Q0A0_WICPI|nr:hypothetical protein WICPIJ_007232 [Wickerhamomyces pijperi]